TEENYLIRMGQLLNSYFNTMNGLYVITGGISKKTAYSWDRNLSFVPAQMPSEILGTRSIESEVIVAHKPWVITLCIASIVLILASLISPVLHHFLIKGPEVMMNLSSLATRGNPHIPLPDGGTFLDASDRARLLRSVRIRHGDIGGKSDVGNLII
ncbi:hypothetical protein EJ07DRAFT_12235, partial [Lizonia empirigonia]